MYGSPSEADTLHPNWQQLGQAWRTEQEIDGDRQRFLTERRAIVPNIEKGIFPFKGIRLTRQDIEWLLATHDGGAGPIDWRNDEQRERDGVDLLGRSPHAGKPVELNRDGLDLRGADVRGVDLSHLPLSRTCFGLTNEQQVSATNEQLMVAAAHLENASMRETHLEGSAFWGVDFRGADIKRAHLEAADMGMARLDGADARAVHFEAADLRWASLQYVDMREARAECTDLRDADLTGAKLDAVHMEGANLRRATLHGANLSNVHLEGRRLDERIHSRISRWKSGFSYSAPPSDLREANFDADTRLDGISLGTDEGGFVRVADLHWKDVNLAVVDWSTVSHLGDEIQATWPYYTVAYLAYGVRTRKRGAQRHARKGQLPRKNRYTRYLEYQAAVRSYRQLATALQVQGLNEESAHFAYRALSLQKTVYKCQMTLRRIGHRKITLRQRLRSFASYCFSGFLDVLAGYGYRPGRTLSWYILTVLAFACAYYVLGLTEGHSFHLDGALVFSVTSFHGRGFFPEQLKLEDWITRLAASEAVIGLFIEISFIATFTQRFFGKGSGA